MDIKKEPTKSKEIIDVNSTVNNLLEKIADAVITPQQANIKTLTEIRNLLYTLRKADKTTSVYLFNDVSNKIEKASSIIASAAGESLNIQTPSRTQDYGDISRKKINEISNQNLDKTIKLLNDSISVIKGTEKISDQIDMPNDASRKIMTDIIFSLLAKQLKEYYYFIFPDRVEKGTQEIDITPLSQKKNIESIPSTIIDEKESQTIAELNITTRKSEQAVDTLVEKDEKNISSVPESEDKTDKRVYGIGEFPDFINKSSDSINEHIESSIVNKKLKDDEASKIDSYDTSLINRKNVDENKVLENQLNKSEKERNNIDSVDTDDKLVNNISLADKGDEKTPNEITTAAIEETKQQIELDITDQESSKLINNLEETANKNEKNINNIESAEDVVEKFINELDSPDEKTEKTRSSINTDIDKSSKSTGVLNPTVFKEPGEINTADPEEASSIIQISDNPSEKVNKDQIDVGIEINKTEKNIVTQVKPSNIISRVIGDTPNVPLVSAIVDILFSAAKSFRYAKEFATKYIGAQLQNKLSMVETYKDFSQYNKEDFNSFEADRPNAQLADALNTAESNRRSDYYKRDSNKIETTDLEKNRENQRSDYHSNRSYLSISNHPENVGYLKIYTKRSMKFQTSQNEICYLPFQFEPKISGESKGASYSAISTLARSTPAQVYKYSNERKIGLELEYLVTGNNHLGESGNSISSMGMKNWTEEYIYNYLIRNFRNLVLPNMSDPKYKLGTPIVQVWYGGLENTTGSSTGMIEDSNNSQLNESHPTFRTNWFSLSSGGYKFHSMRSLWLCENVSFEYKGGIIGANERHYSNIVISVSLIEIGPAVTDNEVLLWAPQ